MGKERRDNELLENQIKILSEEKRKSQEKLKQISDAKDSLEQEMQSMLDQVNLLANSQSEGVKAPPSLDSYNKFLDESDDSTNSTKQQFRYEIFKQNTSEDKRDPSLNNTSKIHKILLEKLLKRMSSVLGKQLENILKAQNQIS